MTSHESSLLVEAHLVDWGLLRPPQHRFVFNARLSNPAGVARYYLIADYLSAGELSDGFDIDVAYVYELSGQGQAMVCHFAGSRGFFALLLPAGAQIVLNNLPLEFWGEVPGQLTLQVTVGQDLQIAGQAAGDWLDINLESDGIAAVDAGALANQREVIHSRSVAAEERKAVTVTAAEQLRLVVSTSI